MTFLLKTLPTWLMGVAVIACSVALALAGMVSVRRHVSSDILAEGRDSAGVTFAAIAGFYGVLAAFVVVAVWEQFDKAVEGAEREASVLGDIYRLVEVFPEAPRERVRTETREYAAAVVGHEWLAMSKLRSSPQTERHFSHLWAAVLAVEPKGEMQSEAYGALLDRLNVMSDHRRMRLISATQGIPGLLWVLLVVGAVLTVGSSFFLLTRHGGLHFMLTLSLTTSITFVLFLIMALDYPYTGSVAVTPDAFEAALAGFR